MPTFSQELFDDICNQITQGASLRAICAHENMPSTSTFMRWVSESDVLQEQYARAMSLRADHIFEEILDIADNAGEDMITLSDGRQVVNHEVVARDRLRVDARKWMAGKMNPKKYGDKSSVDVTSGGEKLDNRIIIEHVDMSKPQNNG